MDPVEQRIILKFLFIKGLGYKAALSELCLVLGECTYSLSQMKRWIYRFPDGNLQMKTKIDQ
jgi:hypothetical protein